MSDGSTIQYKKVIQKTMTYIVRTNNRGLYLRTELTVRNPRTECFTITERTDRKHATNLETRKGLSGLEVTLNGSPMLMRSVGQKIIALLVTEEELIALTQCAQEMIHVMRLLELMKLKVSKPMILESDNKGALNICNSWTVGGRTTHIDTRCYFLRKLKEENIMELKWISGKENSVDLFTKNFPNPTHAKHTGYYCTDEEFEKYGKMFHGCFSVAVIVSGNC